MKCKIQETETEKETSDKAKTKSDVETVAYSTVSYILRFSREDEALLIFSSLNKYKELENKTKEKSTENTKSLKECDKVGVKINNIESNTENCDTKTSKNESNTENTKCDTEKSCIDSKILLENDATSKVTLNPKSTETVTSPSMANQED